MKDLRLFAEGSFRVVVLVQVAFGSLGVGRRRQLAEAIWEPSARNKIGSENVQLP